MNVMLLRSAGVRDDVLYNGLIAWYEAFPPRVILWMGDKHEVFILSDGQDMIGDAWVYFEAGFVALKPVQPLEIENAAAHAIEPPAEPSL